MTIQILSAVVWKAETLPELYLVDPFALTGGRSARPPFICGPSAMRNLRATLNGVDLTDRGLPRGGMIEPAILTDDPTAGPPIPVSAPGMRYLRDLLNDMDLGE